MHVTHTHTQTFPLLSVVLDTRWLAWSSPTLQVDGLLQARDHGNTRVDTEYRFLCLQQTRFLRPGFGCWGRSPSKWIFKKTCFEYFNHYCKCFYHLGCKVQSALLLSPLNNTYIHIWINQSKNHWWPLDTIGLSQSANWLFPNLSVALCHGGAMARADIACMG